MTDTFIQSAETDKLISKPSFAEFPVNSPLHVAFRLIELRKGTISPMGALKRRVAFGVADTPEQAAHLSGFEAVERYALQYSEDQDPRCQSLITSDDVQREMPRTALAIGAPKTNGTITSKGAAAGQTRSDATLRAVYECLEHALDQKGEYTYRASPRCLPQELNAWLALHLRKLEIHVQPVPEIGLLIRAVCCDLDQGRPSYGTAFTTELKKGALSAAGEAIVSWRNMVTLEHKGVIPQDMDAEEQRFFELYRGARADQPPSPSAEFNPASWPAQEANLARVINCTAEILGKPIAVFDMTAPEIPLPVVKAVPIVG